MKIDKYERGYREITRRLVETFAISLFAMMVLVQFYNIFSRYTRIGRPMMWVEEFTRYAFIWITFLMWHLCQRRGTHFVVDIVPSKVSDKSKYFLDIFRSFAIIFFACLAIYSSWLYIPSTMIYCAQSFRTVPMGIFYLAIPIGVTLVLIEEILILINKIQKTTKVENNQ